MNVVAKWHNIDFFYYREVLFVRDSFFGTAIRNFIAISKDLPQKRFVIISTDKSQDTLCEKYYLVDMTAGNPNNLIITRPEWNNSLDLDGAVDLFKEFFWKLDKQK